MVDKWEPQCDGTVSTGFQTPKDRKSFVTLDQITPKTHLKQRTAQLWNRRTNDRITEFETLQTKRGD
jgi:hypothetical protein